jgi:phage terminase large subunit GpA-like protein
LNVNKYKDILSNHVGLVWDTKTTKIQPNNFLNFPSPVNGLYTEQSYFNHYAAEHKIIDEKSRKLVWQKVDSTKQNHMFDCRIYAMAARDIFIFEFFRTMKQKQGIWSDFVAIMNGKI